MGATIINDEMKLAMVYALADLATEETPESVVAAYGGNELTFGEDYLIPTIRSTFNYQTRSRDCQSGHGQWCGDTSN